MSHLFTPITLGRLNLNNRIIIAPMCQYSAVQGKANDWHSIHLGQLAISGAGLLIIEATAISPDGRISPQDLGLWDDETAQALAKVFNTVKTYAAMPIGIQLNHAGRKASCQVPWQGGKQISPQQPAGWQTIAPSAIASESGNALPVAMSLAEISVLKEQFVAAAQRADHIGFSLFELHAAHGYLLHQFLSPLSNQREDQYGGSLENRLRLVLEVFQAVRAVIPAEKAVGVRISATDWLTGGWDENQSVILAQALKDLGCDYIHVSSGGLSAEQIIPIGPNYQVAFAHTIKQQVGIATIAVGLITEPEQAEAIIANQQADMVALARAMLFNPRWPWHAAQTLGATVVAPLPYLRSEPHGTKGLLLGKTL